MATHTNDTVTAHLNTGLQHFASEFSSLLLTPVHLLNDTSSHCPCRTGCFQTDSCNGTMVEFTKTSTECCDGFGREESMDSILRSHYSYFRGNHRSHKSNILRTEGCTISESSNTVTLGLQVQ